MKLPPRYRINELPSGVIALRFDLAMLEHCQHGDEGERESENKHHPVDKSGKGAGIERFHTPTTPAFVTTAPHGAHNSRTEHASGAQSRSKRGKQKEDK